MSLKIELEQFRQEFLAKVPKEKGAIMTRADAELAERDVIKHALKTGDLAPEVVAPDVNGKLVSLTETLKYGPVILVFYRGGWCPYCNLELRAYQRLLSEIQKAGGQLIAISPQSVDASLSTQEKNGLAYPVLTDLQSQAARAFGILFELPAELRQLYQDLGHGLDTINASGEWALPVPATYVIAPNRQIVQHHVQLDYRTRMEPQTAFDAVKMLLTRRLVSLSHTGERRLIASVA